MTDDEKAIRKVIETWMSTTSRGDAKTVLSLMTDDVVFLVPGQKPFGKEAFEAASEGQNDMQIDGKSEIQELKVLGDWAFMRSYLEVVMTPPGAAPVKRTGHTLTILRKGADGAWRLARDANLLTVEE